MSAETTRSRNITKKYDNRQVEDNCTQEAFAYKNGETNVRKSFEEDFLLPIAAFRIFSVFMWTGGILYSTYHVYLAAEEMLPWQRDPIMNPGPFTQLLNRGRDVTDSEWVTFAPIIWTKLPFFFALYVVLKHLCSNAFDQNKASWVSPAVSFIFMWNLTGLPSTMYLYLMPVVYWGLLRSRSKLAVWIVTFLFILALNSSLVQVIVRGNSVSQYYFVVTAAWNYARCISFCFDVWDRPSDQKFSLSSLASFVQYVFYMPLIITGPLVLYERFENQVLVPKKQDSSNRSKYVGDLGVLIKQLGKLLAITALNELIYHYLYFRPLSLTTAAIYEINLWAVCGTIYWLGQFFTMKYKVMYGVPSCLAEFDGLELYPLPRCPAYIHRYSVLWKDFDRGLYYFLVRYIYIPSIQLMKAVDPRNKASPEVHKLIASFATFVYVYIWHSTSFEVLVWSALNFLGITIERIGSLIKRKIDSVTYVEPMVWDFIIEPIVTVPLAGMSILNSSVFCGTLDSATAFATRLWIDRADNYAFYFLFCFTHVAVTVRTWDSFSTAVISRLKLNVIRNNTK